LPPNARPDVTVSIYDGILQTNVLQSGDTRGWFRKQNLAISNANYLRFTNDNAGVALVSFSAELLRYKGVGSDTVMTDVQVVGPGGTLAIQPGVTEDWVVTDIGSSAWLNKQGDGVPNLEVDITDGTLAARILASTEVRMWEAGMKLYVNNANYLLLTNSAGVAANVGWSAELHQRYGVGASVVKTDVLAAGAGASVDFRPPAGEEWDVTMLGSSAWIGISPLEFPNLTASLYDGTNAAPVQNADNWRLNGHELSLRIDHDNYLRVNDAIGGAGQNIGISAHVVQRYAA